MMKKLLDLIEQVNKNEKTVADLLAYIEREKLIFDDAFSSCENQEKFNSAFFQLTSKHLTAYAELHEFYYKLTQYALSYHHAGWYSFAAAILNGRAVLAYAQADVAPKKRTLN